MKKITLPKVLDSLRSLSSVVTVDQSVAQKAKLVIDKMLEIH